MWWIYFIQIGEEGPIKIGKSLSPYERLDCLQQASPWQLQLVAAREGPAELEKEYHQKFHDLRMKGEWFESADSLMEEIAKVGLPKRLKHKRISWPKI